MRRTFLQAGPLLLMLAFMARPASAQVVQSLQVGGGVFVPRGAGARATGDVLVEDQHSLAFKMNDLTSGQVFGEWGATLGGHVELSAGVGYYRGTAHSVYQAYTNPDGSEIRQQLQLRVVPITGLVRFLPVGTPSGVQPYVGVGVSALRYRYVESGDFIDFTDFSVFNNRYLATGTAYGPVIVAGLRVPLGGDIWGLTTEWRYQGGVGTTGGTNAGFLADKIDLSGNNVNVGLLLRF